jgi:hypothetical protein
VLLHADACQQMGLDTAELGEADTNGVLRWLRERGGRIPASLAEDILRIDDLTDPHGADALLDVGREADHDLRRLGLDPVEVAVNAFLEQRPLFERAHGRRLVATLRRATEYAGRKAVPLRPIDQEALDSLEASLGQHFDARQRSRPCDITMERDGDRLVFEVAHGTLVRKDEALDDIPVPEEPGPVRLPERIFKYRPLRRDVIVYDGRKGSLRVKASDAPSLHAYRRGFGELLQGDPEWFGTGPVVSLEPLITLGQAVEEPTPGLREVRLVGLVVRYDAGRTGTIALQSQEMWAFLADRLNVQLDEGELLEATFRVKRVGRPQAAHALVRGPNHVDCKSAEEAVRPWLETRGFLALNSTGRRTV